MITIHEANASDFTTLGLGALTPTECMIEEKAGGLYELTLVQPITDDYRHTLIAQHRIVKAPAPVRETPLIELNQTGSVQREIYRVATGGARLNMRATPNGKILHSYTPGTEVVKLGQNDDGTWMQVALMDGGATGWMFTEYLQLARTETEVVSGDTPGVVQPRQTREQLFRIIDMEPDTKTRTVTAWAQHITYDLKGAIVVGEYEPEDVAADVVCAQLMARADHDVSDFRIYCAVDGKISGSYGSRNILDCLLDPETGVAAQTGARVVRDNYDVFLLPDEERSRGVELRYGKNLLSAAMTTSVADVITRIRPVGKDAEGNKLYIEDNNGFVDSPRIGDYPVIYSKEIEYDVAVSDDLPVNQAREQLKARAQADFDAGCDLASAKLDVDFVRLELTDEYRHLANAYALHLYDRVPVIDREAGIEASVRMIGYRYDGLLDRYDKTILGDIGDVETTVHGYEIAGSVQGNKIVPGSLSGDRLRNLSVGYGKFAAAAIGQLAVNAVTAVRADIRKLVAGEITTDQLYADLAEIAVAQITTANIKNATIDWAQIANLTAEIANIASAEIDTAKIKYSQIYDADLKNAIITQGVTGKLYVANLAVTEANIVSLTLGELILKDTEGNFKKLTVNEEGQITAEVVEVKGENIANGTIPGGKLIENTITARELNAEKIFADEALVKKMFVSEATIAELNTWLIKADTIQSIGSNLTLEIGGTNLVSRTGASITTGAEEERAKDAYTQSGRVYRLDAFSGDYNILLFPAAAAIRPGAYTLSFTAWLEGGASGVTLNCNLNNGKSGSGARDVYFGYCEPTAAKARYEIAYNADYTDGMMLRFVVAEAFTGGSVCISDVKLEEGKSVTAWSPSPDEPGAAIEDGSSFRLNKNEIVASTQRFAVSVPGASGDSLKMQITEEGAVFDHVEAPNVAKRYDGAATITVKPDATSAEIAAGGVYRGLTDAFQQLNNRNLDYDVTINVQGDSYGDGVIELCGVCGSSHGLTINGNGYSAVGSFRAANCPTRITINNLHFDWNSSGQRDYAADFDNCGSVELNGCVVNGMNGAARGLYLAWGTRAVLKNCEFYGATDSLIKAGDNVDLVVVDAKGAGAYFIWTDGANVKWSGTRPSGAWWQGLPSLVYDDLSSHTVSGGSADIPEQLPSAMSYTLAHSDSYAGGTVKSWVWEYPSHPEDENDIRQGYTATVGRVYGCMWFDNAAIRSFAAGATIKQATLRLTRMTGFGSARAAELRLMGTATEYASRSGAPGETTDYGVIGSILPGETLTITIPAAAASDLASGAINGLMLYSPDTAVDGGRSYSKNYAKLYGETSGDESTKPVLTITKQ